MTRRLPRFVVAVAVLAGAAFFALRGQWPWNRLPDVPIAQPIVVTTAFRMAHDTLQQGETVSTLLKRQGVRGIDFAAVAKALGFDPRLLKAGLVFSVRHDPATDEPTHIEFRPSTEQRFRLVRAADGTWTGVMVPIRWTTDTIRCSEEIQTTLYDAVDQMNCDPRLDRGERVRLAYELADVNEWSVDFSRDVQSGDRFSAVVERQISEDGEVHLGDCLASEVTVGHKTLDAFAFTHADGQRDYYDGDGNAVRRAFLKVPVQFRYISSAFSYRVHPILGTWLKHQGTDYAAPTGTPVRAAGNGVVTIAGWHNDYGNMIEIRHANGITTRYGHLSLIEPGIRPGVHVAQSDVIGLVGMTGMATGPHLHYEFRVNGVARDPESVKSEAGPPLPPQERAEFLRRRALLGELLNPGAPVASPVITD